MNHEDYMKEALDLARKALLKGEVPVGAIIVLNNKIIGRGYNQSITTNDPSAHAEVVALRDAGNTCKNYRLNKATIYTTLEPCLMCTGALIHSRIKDVIFSTRDPKSGVIVSNGNLLRKMTFLNHSLSYKEGYLQESSSNLLNEFFIKRRLKLK